MKPLLLIIPLVVVFFIVLIYKGASAKSNSCVNAIISFPFKQNCISKGGALGLNDDGVLLKCVDIIDYKPTNDINSATYQALIDSVKNGTYKVDTEDDRLKTYLKVHSDLTGDPININGLSTPKLKIVYDNLPYHFNLPESMMPTFHTLSSEIQHIQERIKNKAYNPKTERDKLLLYIKIVYPNINTTKLNGMSTEKLVRMYQKFEFYYKLPESIMPTTSIPVRRTEKTKFYRIPAGVVLQQDPNRSAIVTPYIEVTRFGPSNNFYRDPSKFTGTFWYPAKGSGLFLPLKNSLIAYNKVHALKMLNVRNDEILKHSGAYFQYFVQKDSNRLLKQSKFGDTSLLKSTCVMTKKPPSSTLLNKCYNELGVNSREITYIPEALDELISEMVSGKSLRFDRRLNGLPNKNGPVVKTYYGLGDLGDVFLAGIAKQRGIETIQLLREAQMNPLGDAVIGNEIIHLLEPVYSQATLLRLDPLSPALYKKSCDSTMGEPTNYLLDSKIGGVDMHLLKSEYSPFQDSPEDINTYVVDRKDY